MINNIEKYLIMILCILIILMSITIYYLYLQHIDPEPHNENNDVEKCMSITKE